MIIGIQKTMISKNMVWFIFLCYDGKKTQMKLITVGNKKNLKIIFVVCVRDLQLIDRISDRLC